MTAADYAHDQRSGNRQGLHYSTFEPPSKKRAHARSTSCSKKIFPRCANPPSWVRPERSASWRKFSPGKDCLEPPSLHWKRGNQRLGAGLLWSRLSVRDLAAALLREW